MYDDELISTCESNEGKLFADDYPKHGVTIMYRPHRHLSTTYRPHRNTQPQSRQPVNAGLETI